MTAFLEGLMREYEVEISTKSNLRAGYFIRRGQRVFLRVLLGSGRFPFDLMTATAGENDKYALGVGDLSISCKAAFLAATEFFKLKGIDCHPTYLTDRSGRPFVYFCSFSEGSESEALIFELIDLYFEKLDELLLSFDSSREGNDLVQIYSDLCVNRGEPVYLSDGLWLTSSGTIITR